jgi:hypothetical protein
VGGNDNRHSSHRGIVRLSRTMHDKGPSPRARKARVKAVADVAEDYFEVQRKLLESDKARVRTAKEGVRKKIRKCAVTQQKPNATDRNPIELEAHHLFDAGSRPDLAAIDENPLAINSALRRNFYKSIYAQNSPSAKANLPRPIRESKFTYGVANQSPVNKQAAKHYCYMNPKQYHSFY